jgi:hypothetical protein
MRHCCTSPRCTVWSTPAAGSATPAHSSSNPTSTHAWRPCPAASAQTGLLPTRPRLLGSTCWPSMRRRTRGTTCTRSSRSSRSRDSQGSTQGSSQGSQEGLAMEIQGNICVDSRNLKAAAVVTLRAVAVDLAGSPKKTRADQPRLSPTTIDQSWVPSVRFTSRSDLCIGITSHARSRCGAAFR